MRGRTTGDQRGCARGPGVLALVAAIAAASGAAALPAAAQTPGAPPAGVPEGAEFVDGIAAVVGDTAILYSELRQEFFRLQASGRTLPPPGTEEWRSLARQILERTADQLILLQQAKRAGITVPEDRVDAATEQQFQQVRSQFSSDEEMAAAVESSGMNMFQYRQMLRSQARAQLLFQAFQGELVRSGALPRVTVTEREAREFFEANYANRERPATISFNRLIVMPRPDSTALRAAIDTAVRAREEIEAGEEFEIVARRYSEDEGTREQGGELGWVRREDLVRSFANAAWSVRAGSVIGPVESRFGLHVIRVENVRGGERFIRHVLIRPEITEADVEEARELAAAFADSLRNGVDPERLARNPAVVDEQVQFGDVRVDQLGQAFGSELARELGGAEGGDVVGPFAVDRNGTTEFVVVEVVGVRSAGQLRFEDVQDEMYSQVRTEKQLDRYLADLRENTYIEFRL